MKDVYKPVKEIVKKDPSERTPEEQELMDEVGTIANSHQYSGLQRMMMRGKRPTKRFNFFKVLDEICEEKGIQPAEAVIRILEEADRVGKESGSTVFELAGLKLQLEAAKLLFNRAYPEKQEHEITGKDGEPIAIQTIEVVIVDPATKSG